MCFSSVYILGKTNGFRKFEMICGEILENVIVKIADVLVVFVGLKMNNSQAAERKLMGPGRGFLNFSW